jgi:stage II sporulation protein D
MRLAAASLTYVAASLTLPIGITVHASSAGPDRSQPVAPALRHPSIDPPDPARGGPVVRVGVALERETVSVSAAAGLILEDPRNGGRVGNVAPGEVLRARADGTTLRLEAGSSALPRGLVAVRAVTDGAAGPLYVGDVPYRGLVELRVAGKGQVSAINELPLEEYLLGVVPLEIGPREPEEIAAVEAQAVAARTYAVAQLGGQGEMGFDLYGSVEDQAYGGMAVEREEATEAVHRTTGRILLFDGRPIRAYYHSTCGGRTAAIEEVLDREPAPYLQSVSDRAPDGSYYCAASPRFEWDVTWTAEELDSVARAGVATAFGLAADQLGPVEHLEVIRRTPSGRVGELAFEGPGMEMVLSRLAIRLALPNDGRILNSTDFDVIDRADGLVELSGRGYGHGAGMCQWGAIGRARAGQSYEQILTTYYPGAVLVKAYDGGDG